MQLWAHTLVKNEERYLWFAVMSVIEQVDKVMIWDTGSTDNTVAIAKVIKRRYPEKVDLQTFGEVTPEEFTGMRQKMLDKTKSDWFMILDGDEVWWDESIVKAVRIIKTMGESLESIVTPYYNLVGDIYHYQEEAAGKYKIDGKLGHLTIRFMSRKIPGLFTAKPHGQQGYFDKDGKLVQERAKSKRKFVNLPYLHFTHLIRSSDRERDFLVPKRGFKYKYELGISFPLDFYYPEVFFKPRPDIVPTPWRKADSNFMRKAVVQTPLRKFKRRIFKGSTGY